MPDPSINVFFDILSPSAYIAFYIMNHDPIFQQVEVTWTPVHLSTILQTCGNKPPIAIKNKFEYFDKDRMRVSRLFGVPMNPKMPDGFPVRTVEVMTHLAALSHASSAHLIPAIAALYEHFFVHMGDVVEPANFLPVLESAIGPELLASVQEEAPGRGKDLLDKNTAHALGEGAFGLPYVAATDSSGVTEFVFGVDHLYIAMQHVGLLPPWNLSGEQEAFWRPFRFAELAGLLYHQSNRVKGISMALN